MEDEVGEGLVVMVDVHGRRECVVKRSILWREKGNLY